jgi:hypothetical protein
MSTSDLFNMLQKYCDGKLESYVSIKIELNEKAGLIIHISIKPQYVPPITFRVAVPEVEISEVERLKMIIDDQNKVIEAQANKVFMFDDYN